MWFLQRKPVNSLDRQNEQFNCFEKGKDTKIICQKQQKETVVTLWLHYEKRNRNVLQMERFVEREMEEDNERFFRLLVVTWSGVSTNAVGNHKKWRNTISYAN